jgi:hypothetical protein
MFIPDPNFSIPDPVSKRFRIPDPNTHQRIYRFLALKNVFKLSAKGSGMFIPDPYPVFFPIPDLGSRGSKRHRVLVMLAHKGFEGMELVPRRQKSVPTLPVVFHRV